MMNMEENATQENSNHYVPTAENKTQNQIQGMKQISKSTQKMVRLQVFCNLTHGMLYADLQRLFKFCGENTGDEFRGYILNSELSVADVLDNIDAYLLNLFIQSLSPEKPNFPKDEEVLAKFRLALKNLEEKNEPQFLIHRKVISHVVSCIDSGKVQKLPPELIDQITKMMGIESIEQTVNDMLKDQKNLSNIIAMNTAAQDLSDKLNELADDFKDTPPEEIPFTRNPQIRVDPDSLIPNKIDGPSKQTNDFC